MEQAQVSLGTCEICGDSLNIYPNYGYQCELCNKIVCSSCILELGALKPTITATTLTLGSGTVWRFAQRGASKSIHMFICSQCADYLKLSLRVLVGRGEDEDNV